MTTKKKKNPAIIIIIILFGIYVALYYLSKSGYYDYKEYNKMILTEEAMKKFEKDIEEGKDITLNDYIKTNTSDYTNKVSKLGLKTGKTIESFFKEGLGNIFKVVSSLVTD